MSSGYAKPEVAIVVIVAVATALLLFVSNTQTILAQPPPTDSITMTANLQTHENAVLSLLSLLIS